MGIKIKKKNQDGSQPEVLISDLIRSMKEQGIAEDDILDIMARAGISSEMGTSLLQRMCEDLDVRGLKTKKTLFREEMDSVMWDWAGEMEKIYKEGWITVEEEVKSLREDQVRIKAEVEKISAVLEGLKRHEGNTGDIQSIKTGMEDVNASVGSFEIYAKEILHALKKMER